MIRDNEFWVFMNERESIRLRRLAGAPRAEWTSDPIFMEYSFTNVKREHDRTTALLRREFYGPHGDDQREQLLLNAILFRMFGTIEFARVLGWHYDFGRAEQKRVIALAAAEKTMGNKIFTPAYIVRADTREPRAKAEFVVEIVADIWPDVRRILDTKSWEVACNRLCSHYSIGSFMAKEFLLDYILASNWEPTDWETWTPVGPGGRLGAGVVLEDQMRRINDTTALMVIRALYTQRFKMWKHEVKLDLTDIQFQLCEFAKYMKVKMGVGTPRRKFNPTDDSITRAA